MQKTITAISWGGNWGREIIFYGYRANNWQKRLDKILSQVPTIDIYRKDSRIIDMQKRWEKKSLYARLRDFYQMKQLIKDNGYGCITYITSLEDPLLQDTCRNIRNGDIGNQIQKFLKKYNFYFDQQIDEDVVLFRLDY